MKVLSVGDIRKAIQGMPDDAVVLISIDSDDEHVHEYSVDLEPVRAYREKPMIKGELEALTIELTDEDLEYPE